MARSIVTAALVALVTVGGAGCSRARDDTHGAPAVASAPPIAALLPDASAPASAGAPVPLMPDEEVGPLLARLSEDPGDFPSDNYVTNETTLLDVAPALRDPRLRGRGYVGVGPDQNFTYLAMLEPRVSYIVDIRRGNFLEHMFFRACFEAGATRVAFLRSLLARRPRVAEAGPAPDGFASLDAAFRGVPADAALREEGLARTRALMARLHVTPRSGDDAELARIHDAFFTRGLALAYTMKGSHRKYPSLGENFAARDASGAAASFLASEQSYARVRRLVSDNRVLPVVGDFGGSHALGAVAADMRARGLVLGAFYTSNVEQYLFDSKTYGAFVRSVSAMPRDEASLLVRVWFDQGRRHPAQRRGHRTTQLTIGADVFLARASEAPFRSYWEVATQPPARASSSPGEQPR